MANSARSRYFQDELTYLKESGRFFAESNPKLARYLSEQSTDPDVERLLEGFAFLTSRLREKLDDELPELTHSVVNLLLPNFLRPFPSTALMKLTPQEKSITERQAVPHGTIILSRPVSGTVCPFRTTSETHVYPLEIEEQYLERSRQSTTLHIDFKTLSGLPLGMIDLRDLRLWFASGDHTAQMLYLWFGRYLKSIDITITGGEGRGRTVSFPLRNVQPGGFAANEAILPSGNTAYEGYRLLQEYFVFPEKFQCFDLIRFGESLGNESGMTFRMSVQFERPLPPDVKVRPDTVQLYCTPAVNLFRHDAEPMKVDHRRLHYPLRPSSNGDGAKAIFSIDRVVSWRSEGEPATGQHLREYRRRRKRLFRTRRNRSRRGDRPGDASRPNRQQGDGLVQRPGRSVRQPTRNESHARQERSDRRPEPPAEIEQEGARRRRSDGRACEFRKPWRREGR